MVSLRALISCLVVVAGPAGVASESFRRELGAQADLQLHLGLTGVDGSSVVVMWSTAKTSSGSGVVTVMDSNKNVVGKFQPQLSETYANSKYITQKATLQGLVAGKQYSYQVSLPNNVLSDVKTFRAPFANISKSLAHANDPWSMFIIGDMGFGPTAQGNVALMKSEKLSNYELMMNVGDISYAFGLDDNWDTYMNLIEPIASVVPWMTCPGNHDVLPVDSGNELGVPMRARFYMPANESKSPSRNYYSFNHRIAHFLTFNTDEDYTPGSPQYKWIEQDLIEANKPENRRVRPWLFVAMHKPMYGSFPNDNRGPDAGLGEPGSVIHNLEPLFLKYNVDIFLTGHDHAYERMLPTMNNGTIIEHSYTNPKSPIHLLVGMGGYIQLGNDPAEMQKYSGYRELSYGYSRMRFLNSTSIKFDYIEVETGSVHDSIMINKFDHAVKAH